MAVRIATQVLVVCFMMQQVPFIYVEWEQERGVGWYGPNMASVLMALLYTSDLPGAQSHAAQLARSR